MSCSLFLKADPNFLGEAVVYDEGGYQEGYPGHSTWAHREPPTTWIKSQACKMALRVSSSAMDTRDC